ncbi:unnamed protein product [Ectocarpus sp. CCAP 1310/34]|nr:unnamed protein product [Ectocarpus sp. CCAP 1310/34]
MEETSSPADYITFCSGVGITDMAQCEDDVYGMGAGSGSMSSGGSAYGSGSGAGGGSELSQGGSAYGYGSGAGGGSMSSTASGAGSGSGGIAGDTASGSALDSASEGVTAEYGSGNGSGAGSMSSSTATASGSGDASRVAEIEGCDCGTAELEPAFAAYFCENGKSMYCDLECMDGSDPYDALFPSMGGLWCQPEGWEGCRMCKFDCTDYEGDGCVPCPSGLKDWC